MSHTLEEQAVQFAALLHRRTRLRDPAAMPGEEPEDLWRGECLLNPLAPQPETARYPSVGSRWEKIRRSTGPKLDEQRRGREPWRRELRTRPSC